jgi:hypothetical protein
MMFTAVLLAAAALFGIVNGRSAINSSVPTGVHVAAVWDPNDIATDDEWRHAVEKGSRLACRLGANDEAAGRLWEDTRTPPSARSEWADVQLKNDFNLWGWHEGDYDQNFVCNFADNDSDGHINRIGGSWAT